MSTALASTPIVECFIRRMFLFDQDEREGGLVPGYIVGFCAHPGRAPAFQVVLEDGSQWAKVPIHMLCWKDCPIPPLGDVSPWDCFSYDFAIAELQVLKLMRCEQIFKTADASAVFLPGEYVFTVQWMGGFAEIPDQHKQHHIVKRDRGDFAALPNNMLRWVDPSWIKPFVGNPGYRPNSHVFAVGK